MDDLSRGLREAGGPESDPVRAEKAVARLENGDEPSAVARDFEANPAQLMTWVAHVALRDGFPSLVQTSPRRPRLAQALGEPALAGLFPAVSRARRLALAAGLLQVCDFWDLSHQAAQQADDLGESEFSAYWHGIAHRREPDAGNASYWFRRVGRHPVFESLAGLVGRTAAHADLAGRLTPRGVWDPYAFIEFCTRARGAEAEKARELQAFEMLTLLGATLPD